MLSQNSDQPKIPSSTQIRSSRKQGRLTRLMPVMVVSTIIMTVLGMFYALDSAEARWLPKCMVHELTGLHCPGCGTTRALHACVHGDIEYALRFNPMFILGGPILCWWLWQRSRAERCGAKVHPQVVYVFVGIIAAYCVLRNVPTPTTSWLAPGMPTLQAQK